VADLIVDSFVGTADVTLESRSPPTGGAWAKNPTGTFWGNAGLALDGAGALKQANGTGGLYHNAATVPADLTLVANFIHRNTTGGGSEIAVLVRMDPTVQTYYLIKTNTTGTELQIRKYVSGSYEQVWENVGLSAFSAGSTHELRVDLRGTNPVTLDVFLDGALALSASDASGSRITSGRCGLWQQGASNGGTNGQSLLDYLVRDYIAPPSLSTVDGDNVVTAGAACTITGTALVAGTTFALLDGATSVSISATRVSDTSWTVASFPLGAARYGARSVRASNAYGTSTIAVTVNPPTGRAYVDLASVHATAGYRFTALPDLATGDQVRALNVGGGPTIADLALYDDASWSGPPTIEFDVQANSGDGTGWGAVGRQYGPGGAGTVLAPYVRTRLIDLDGVVQPNLTGLTLCVWRGAAGPTTAAAAPDQCIQGVTTDASGYVDQIIATGSLVAGDKVWFTLHKPGTPDLATMRRLAPTWR
jgi:hypothetical protein